MKESIYYLSGRPIDIAPSHHVMASVVRNEALRLPYLLAYYRKLGFDRFIFIDNGSTDGTRELLLAQPEVFVFQKESSFAASQFGMDWVNHILDEFCDGNWVLLADADECLIWSGSETSTIQALTARLAAESAEGLFTIMVDMYSRKAFGRIGYVPGRSFIEYAPFFDRRPYRLIAAALFPYWQIYGGVRERVFRALGRTVSPTMSKVPLLRWRKGQRFAMVAHGLASPLTLARMRGALLHFKLLDDIYEKCRREAARGEHFDRGSEYVTLGAAIERARHGSFYEPGLSTRYRDTAGLLAMGILSEESPFGPSLIGGRTDTGTSSA